MKQLKDYTLGEAKSGTCANCGAKAYLCGYEIGEENRKEVPVRK